jgi:hypothetical protein
VFPIELRRSASLDVQLPKPVALAFTLPRCSLHGASGRDAHSDDAPTVGRRLLAETEPHAEELSGSAEPASGDVQPRVERPPSAEVGGDDGPAAHFGGTWTLKKVLQPGELTAIGSSGSG